MHIGRKGEVALSTNDGGSALITYGKKGGDNATEQLKNYEKSFSPYFPLRKIIKCSEPIIQNHEIT